MFQRQIFACTFHRVNAFSVPAVYEFRRNDVFYNVSGYRLPSTVRARVSYLTRGFGIRKRNYQIGFNRRRLAVTQRTYYAYKEILFGFRS